MPRLEEREYTYFTTVRGMCRHCRRVVPARVFFKDGRVWQESLCPTCDNRPAKITDSQDWYLTHVPQPMPDHSPLPGSHPPTKGCPHDCGPCAWHASPCQLPVISITNACNLRCPICFTYNRADQIYHMPVEEMKRTVDWIISSTGQVDLINITGGEPTLHPHVFDILSQCQRPEIGRITLNSNGIRLAEDYSLCEKLAERNVYVILSFNSLDPDVSTRLHGRNLVDVKLKAIDNLGRTGVRMTLLNVMIRDTNENAIADLMKLMWQHDNILSLTIQTMTYTGQGGGRYEPATHIPVDEAARIVCEQSDGDLALEDFVTRPSAHPLCYLIAYMLKGENAFVPFTRFSSPDRIREVIQDSYLIRPGAGEAFFKETVDMLYADGQTEHLPLLRDLLERIYPSDKAITDFERQRIAEDAVRTVYIHAHMDEDTFDCSRAMLCPDLVPSQPGRFIPACTYNLFYRMQDERFYVK